VQAQFWVVVTPWERRSLAADHVSVVIVNTPAVGPAWLSATPPFLSCKSLTRRQRLFQDVMAIVVTILVILLHALLRAAVSSVTCVPS